MGSSSCRHAGQTGISVSLSPNVAEPGSPPGTGVDIARRSGCAAQRELKQIAFRVKTPFSTSSIIFLHSSSSSSCSAIAETSIKIGFSFCRLSLNIVNCLLHISFGTCHADSRAVMFVLRSVQKGLTLQSYFLLYSHVLTNSGNPHSRATR